VRDADAASRTIYHAAHFEADQLYEQRILNCLDRANLPAPGLGLKVGLLVLGVSQSIDLMAADLRVDLQNPGAVQSCAAAGLAGLKEDAANQATPKTVPVASKDLNSEVELLNQPVPVKQALAAMKSKISAAVACLQEEEHRLVRHKPPTNAYLAMHEARVRMQATMKFRRS